MYVHLTCPFCGIGTILAATEEEIKPCITCCRWTDPERNYSRKRMQQERQRIIDAVEEAHETPWAV